MKKILKLIFYISTLFLSVNYAYTYFVTSNKITDLFESINYNISINGNGGIFTTHNLSLSNDNLYIPKPLKNGYDFLGYSNSINGNVQYDLNVKASNINNTVIYAQWTPSNYSINYTLNGGINNINNPASYNIESDTINILNPSKNNFIFIGWSGDNITIPKGSTGNKFYTANWSENHTDFWIKYNANGGSWNNNITEYTQYYQFYHNSEILKLTSNDYDGSNPMRKGWNFNGWNPNPSTNNHYNQTVYASWIDQIPPIYGEAYLSYVGPGASSTSRYYEIHLNNFIEEGSGLKTHCWFLQGMPSWDCMDANKQIDNNGFPYEYGGRIRCNANHKMSFYFIDNAGNKSDTGTVDFYVPCN